MEWRPIESAPRDGTEFLAFEAGEGAPDIWPNMMAVGFIQKIGEHEYFYVAHYAGHEAEFMIEKPTHWMPLPEPPK